MKLIRRDCPVKITITPCSSYCLEVELEINGDRHTFMPSGAMSFFFSEFMGAVYGLYFEGNDCHNHPFVQNYSKRAKHTSPAEDPTLSDDTIRIESKICWDEEGPMANISFCRLASTRSYFPPKDDADTVTVTISYEDRRDISGTYSYTVDGRDLCYAIGKAATDVIKKYGFHGYHYSTGCDTVIYDLFDMNQLVFFKAYALNAMEARTLKEEGWGFSSSFEEELELLLFEM